MVARPHADRAGPKPPDFAMTNVTRHINPRSRPHGCLARLAPGFAASARGVGTQPPPMSERRTRIGRPPGKRQINLLCTRGNEIIYDRNSRNYAVNPRAASRVCPRSYGSRDVADADAGRRSEQPGARVRVACGRHRPGMPATGVRCVVTSALRANGVRRRARGRAGGGGGRSRRRVPGCAAGQR